MAIGRNEPCSCGSGQKYKNCCAGKSTRGVSKGLISLMVAIGLVAAFGLVGAYTDRDKAPAAAGPGGAAPPATAGRPQPGPAPPGKVWSTEHGHWHDAAPGGGNTQTVPIQAPPQQQQFKPGPQPPGPVPAGKVWSAEHGHWHDAPK